MNTYRLEFNEQQQQFHLDDYTHEADANGWFTITEHCTDLEFKIFEAYVNRTKVDRLTKEYLLKSIDEIRVFINNLIEYKISIMHF